MELKATFCGDMLHPWCLLFQSLFLPESDSFATRGVMPFLLFDLTQFAAETFPIMQEGEFMTIITPLTFLEVKTRPVKSALSRFRPTGIKKKKKKKKGAWINKILLICSCWVHLFVFLAERWNINNAVGNRVNKPWKAGRRGRKSLIAARSVRVCGRVRAAAPMCV